MKTFRVNFTCFAFFLLISTVTFSQGFGVEWKFNGTNGNKLNDIYVVNSSYALAVGDYGTVWKTNNGGSSWTLLEVPWTSDCFRVWCTDASTIFIVTKDSNTTQSLIRRSTDNGVTWTSKYPGGTSQDGIVMITKDYGYALSGYYIIRTTNFFTTQSSYYQYNMNTELCASDSLNIYAVYSSYITRTSNAGNTWTSVSLTRTIKSLNMIDSTGYAINSANSKELLKTTDKGSSFSSAYSFPGTIQKFVFASKDTGFALVTDGYENNTIYKTVNGGTVWTSLRNDVHLLSLHQYQKNCIFAAGSGGKILSTNNAGSLWRSNNKTGYDLNCVSFPTPDTGFIAGNDGAFYKTTNGGTSFTRLYPASNKDIHDMYFLDSLNGFIAGENGLLKKTTNGGINFYDLPVPDTLRAIMGLSFYTQYNYYTGYALLVFLRNSDNHLYISNDTCRTWTQLTFPFNEGVSDIDGPYIGTWNGSVYKYDAATSQLVLSFSGVLSYQTRVKFRSSAYYTNDIEVYATDNKGLTACKKLGYLWQTGDNVLAANEDFASFHSLNFITGSKGSVFTSEINNNAGLTGWQQIPLPTHATIRSITSRTDSEFWIVGTDGTVMTLLKDPASQFQMSMDTAYMVAGDTAVMDVNLDYLGAGFSSLQFSIYGSNEITLVGVDTAGTLMGAKKWTCLVNGAVSPARFVAGGANDITSTGTLVRLKYRVNNGVAPKDIPTSVSYLIVNSGTHYPSVLRSGVVKVVKYGDVDVNGAVQAYDASMILKSLVNYVTLTPAQKKIGDVSKDGSLSDVDASLVFRYVVGLVDSLPAPGAWLATGVVNMHDYNVAAGQNIDIPVSMNDVTGLMGFESSITFDAQKLEFTGATTTGIAQAFAIEHKVSNGNILVAAASQNDASGSGEAVILHFKVKNNAQTGGTKVIISRLRLNENSELLNAAEANINITTGINDAGSIPGEYDLAQNYPNPFNPETRIAFALPEAGMVSLRVYNSLGEEVATLVDGEKTAGYYSLNWNAANFPSGVYLIKIAATSGVTGKSFTRIRKMVLMK